MGRRREKWFKNWAEDLEIKEGNVEEELKVMGDNLRGALEEIERGRETIRRGGNTVGGMGIVGRVRRRLRRC